MEFKACPLDGWQFHRRGASPLTWLQRFRYHRRHLAQAMYLAALSEHLFMDVVVHQFVPLQKSLKSMNDTTNGGQYQVSSINPYNYTGDYRQGTTVFSTV